MPWDLIDAMRAAEARILGVRRREDERVLAWLALYDEDALEEALDDIWEDHRDPAFNRLPENTKPGTRRQRAQARAKASAASRVRDRSELDLCHGTRSYLGVACPGCRACEEQALSVTRGNPAEVTPGRRARRSRQQKGEARP